VIDQRSRCSGEHGSSVRRRSRVTFTSTEWLRDLPMVPEVTQNLYGKRAKQFAVEQLCSRLPERGAFRWMRRSKPVCAGAWERSRVCAEIAVGRHRFLADEPVADGAPIPPRPYDSSSVPWAP